MQGIIVRHANHRSERSMRAYKNLGHSERHAYDIPHHSTDITRTNPKTLKSARTIW